MFAFRAIVSDSMLMHSIASTCGHSFRRSTDKHFARLTLTHATTKPNGYILRDRMQWTHTANTFIFNSLNKRSIYSSNTPQQRPRLRHRRRSFTSRAILDFFREFLFSFPFCWLVSYDNRVQSGGRKRCSSCSTVDSLLIAGKYFVFEFFMSSSKRSWRARCAKQGEFRDDEEPAAAAYPHVISQSPAEAQTNTHKYACEYPVIPIHSSKAPALAHYYMRTPAIDCDTSSPIFFRPSALWLWGIHKKKPFADCSLTFIVHSIWRLEIPAFLSRSRPSHRFPPRNHSKSDQKGAEIQFVSFCAWLSRPFVAWHFFPHSKTPKWVAISKLNATILDLARCCSRFAFCCFFVRIGCRYLVSNALDSRDSTNSHFVANAECT